MSRSLKDIRLFLDSLSIPTDNIGNPDPEAGYQAVESASISILDSEWTNFDSGDSGDSGDLEHFLFLYLELWRLENGLTPYTDEPPVQ